jgi:hypothetical protein
VSAARALIGEREIVVRGVDYGPGCAALVQAALHAAGRPLPRDARDAGRIHALAASRRALKPFARAAAGDLVFLADREGGPPAHVGLVARVDGDGTALVLHRTSRGVLPLRVNADARAADAGRRTNDTLLVEGRPVPAASLVVGAADLLR